jgi:uncharacterized membrane protein (UPF0127 family)
VWRWRGPLVLGAALLLPSAACGGDDAATTDRQPQGFELTAAEVTAADGEVCPLCLWVADSPEQRRRGLTGVSDLGPADGMLFRFVAPSRSSFHMVGVPIPLSVAFFSDGSFVSAADMATCPDEHGVNCPAYGSGGPFTAAIEVPAGDLDDLGIGPGSRLVVLGEPCPPAPPSSVS